MNWSVVLNFISGMKMRQHILLFLIITLFLLLPTGTKAQKKKEVKRNGIKTLLVTKTDGTLTINDSKTLFNADGLPLEEYSYDEQGQLKTLVKYKYNADKNVVEESEYNGSKVLIKKQTYKYNAAGDKTEELSFDANGKKIKRSTYTYDYRGLKTSKTTYDSSNKLVLTKKYIYSTR